MNYKEEQLCLSVYRIYYCVSEKYASRLITMKKSILSEDYKTYLLAEFYDKDQALEYFESFRNTGICTGY